MSLLTRRFKMGFLKERSFRLIKKTTYSNIIRKIFKIVFFNKKKIYERSRTIWNDMERYGT
jgi:hypothetical protein